MPATHRIHLKRNVKDAALERVRRIYRDFKHVTVSCSGGKDSTATLNLALQVAEEMGRLPVDVAFVDQESEWDVVIQHIRQLRDDPRIRMRWYQMPIRFTNSTSPNEPFMWAWKAGEKWLREKDPGTIQENTFGTDRFKELFGAIEAKAHPNEPSAYLAGMRAEENPGRSLGLTSVATYQEVTWAKCLDKAKDPAKRIHFTFYPIYDWSYTDVWKFIHESGAPYCKLYDYMYQYGIPVREMRVSSLTHETAVKTMFFMQEIEPDTWNRLVQRLAGVNTISHLREDTTAAPKELPYMFETWTEYRDHLLDNLVLNPEHRERMRTKYARIAHMYRPEVLDGFVQMTITSILTNDFEFTKMDNWIATHINDRKYRNHNTECPECNGKGDPA